MIKIKLPVKVEYIIDKLERAGFETYVVGGCVRDSLMGKAPKDWDITTSALPEQVIEVFDDCTIVPTGIQHGTVTVVLQNDGEPDGAFEVTTFRKDGQYDDSRHPNNVEFVSDIQEDLSRRDFTINAMAYNYTSGLIDPFGGENDLEKGIIRCVGNPVDRFNEDALRRLRALRFALTYSFAIEEETYKALNAKLIKAVSCVSVERIRSEFSRMLKDTYFSSISDIIHYNRLDRDVMINYFRLFMVVIQDITGQTWMYPRGIYENLERTYNDLTLRLAVVFHDCDVESVMKNLRYSNKLIKEVATIHSAAQNMIDEFNGWQKKPYSDAIAKYYFEYIESPQKSGISHITTLGEIKSLDYMKFVRYLCRDVYRKTHNCVMTDIIFDYLKAVLADAKDQKLFAYTYITENVFHCIQDDFRESGFADMRYLTVDGNDVMSIGYKGKEIGAALDDVVDQIMQENLKNSHNEIMNYLTDYYNKMVNCNG